MALKGQNIDRALGQHVIVESSNIPAGIIIQSDVADDSINDAKIATGSFPKITGIGTQTIDLNITDKDIVTGTGTGSIFGKTAAEKIGFHGKAPVIQQTALTAADAVTIDATFDATEQTTMINMRTRINELETKLQALGLLA